MEILNQILAVGFVLGLLGGLVWWLRRRGVARFAWPAASGRARLIEVLESRPLGAQHTLHVVRVADRAFFLAAHPSGCSLVESRPIEEIRKGERNTCSAVSVSC